jgi:hypothetical protein
LRKFPPTVYLTEDERLGSETGVDLDLEPAD